MNANTLTLNRCVNVPYWFSADKEVIHGMKTHPKSIGDNKINNINMELNLLLLLLLLFRNQAFFFLNEQFLLFYYCDDQSLILLLCSKVEEPIVKRRKPLWSIYCCSESFYFHYRVKCLFCLQDFNICFSLMKVAKNNSSLFFQCEKKQNALSLVFRS